MKYNGLTFCFERRTKVSFLSNPCLSSNFHKKLFSKQIFQIIQELILYNQKCKKVLFKRSWRARALLNIGKFRHFVCSYLFLYSSMSPQESSRVLKILSESQRVSVSLSESQRVSASFSESQRVSASLSQSQPVSASLSKAKQVSVSFNCLQSCGFMGSIESNL